MDFRNIEYLKEGTEAQKQVYEVLTQYAVLKILNAFDPILTGTFPLAINIDSSDIDIACHWTNSKAFEDCLSSAFGKEAHFTIRSKSLQNHSAIIANFNMAGFELEVFGQNIPVEDQLSYRHMLIEHRLLLKHGEAFKDEIIKLKKNGLKTEPAFAKLLGIEGDPYEELLKYYAQ